MSDRHHCFGHRFKFRQEDLMSFTEEPSIQFDQVMKNSISCQAGSSVDFLLSKLLGYFNFCTVRTGFAVTRPRISIYLGNHQPTYSSCRCVGVGLSASNEGHMQVGHLGALTGAADVRSEMLPVFDSARLSASTSTRRAWGNLDRSERRLENYSKLWSGVRGPKWSWLSRTGGIVLFRLSSHN